MDWDIKRIGAHVGGPGPVQPGGRPDKPARTPESQGGFRATLDKLRDTKQAPNVTVSAHAAERLMQRGINLDQADLVKISDAMDQAAEKGAKESLFVLRDLALVVSVENRTVITALQGQNARDNVFTQIDSAMLL